MWAPYASGAHLWAPDKGGVWGMVEEGGVLPRQAMLLCSAMPVTSRSIRSLRLVPGVFLTDDLPDCSCLLSDFSEQPS